MKWKIYIEKENRFEYYTLKELIEENILKKYEVNSSNIYMNTGAYDCVGDEIFEGDICIVGLDGKCIWEECDKERYENVSLAIVENCKETFGWKIKFKDCDDEVKMLYDTEWYNPNTYRNIGSIANIDLNEVDEQEFIKAWYKNI